MSQSAESLSQKASSMNPLQLISQHQSAVRGDLAERTVTVPVERNTNEKAQHNVLVQLYTKGKFANMGNSAQECASFMDMENLGILCFFARAPNLCTRTK